MMRIITGSARGIKLATLAGNTTRPTSERAKEAIFSMLQFELQGVQVLDLFAGSGQMALEALSRGAAHAVLCDRSKDAIEVIRANASKTKLALKCDVFCSDFPSLLKSFQKKRKFDLVFLDPPYAIGALPSALGALLDLELLNDGARIVCESQTPADVFGGESALEGRFEVLRAARYGIAHVTLLRVRNEGEEGTV